MGGCLPPPFLDFGGPYLAGESERTPGVLGKIKFFCREALE